MSGAMKKATDQQIKDSYAEFKSCKKVAAKFGMCPQSVHERLIRERGNYNHSHGSWKSAWRIIGGKRKFFRSRWEANYARYLELLKLQGKIADWFHEPETFWFKDIMRGTRSYLPDFKVIELDGSHRWVEVKGWMDDRSKTKLKRFAKYYPKEKMELVQAKWFKDNSTSLQAIIKDWEV